MSINGKIKTVKCKNCNKKMVVLLSIIKTGRKKYCSKKCYSEKIKKSGLLSNNKNPAWKGNNVGYFSLHNWIKRKLGKANKCVDCDNKNAKKYEWSNKDHKYSRNIKDYFSRCVSCHRKYDIKNNLIKKRIRNKLGQFI